ncbi:ependymin-2-like [Micropterus dolomieu]|uniref:ependymin-2-like n=1 Tax=Micropterus dolomieu TaxID=147949 RepID=UPI001E8DA0EB|nr:ependymin-2-like [Micropterus dolomieu]
MKVCVVTRDQSVLTGPKLLNINYLAVLSCLSLLLVPRNQNPAKVYYEIDWSKLSCKKKALDTTFIPMQVPPDAKLIGQAFMGSSSSWGMGVLVNTWTGDLPESGKYMTIFTETGCIPVNFTGYTPASGWTTVRGKIPGTPHQY